MNIPWYEKYKPSSLEEVVGNEKNVNVIKNIAIEKKPLNLLFHGYSGVGKTSCINCLINDIKTLPRDECVLEINVSDERNVLNVLRDFVRKKTDYQLFVILEELDNISLGLQHTLCSLMDKNSHIFFIFSCKDTSLVIEKIQLRCIIFVFTKIEQEIMRNYIINFLQREKIQYDNEGVNHIVFFSNGDMRSALNNLQIVFYYNREIKIEFIRNIIKIPVMCDIEEIVSEAIDGSEEKLNNSLCKLNNLVNTGYDSNDIVMMIYDVLKTYENIDKIKMAGETHSKIIDGCGGFIQLTALLCELSLK